VIDPLVGSWLVQVEFSPTHEQVPARLRGQTEQLLMTFVPGGALVASGPYATTAAGHWHAEEDGSYTYLLVELVFDEHAVRRVVVPSANILLDADTFAVRRGLTRVSVYEDGERTAGHEIAIDANDADPAERVTGQRIGRDWAPPACFAPGHAAAPSASR
jgi:hypothetical protein